MDKKTNETRKIEALERIADSLDVLADVIGNDDLSISNIREINPGRFSDGSP